MANKIKDSNITPGTIAADKLAGGITNSQLAGSIATSKLATDLSNASNISSGTLANARLTGSGSITINGTSVALGGSVVADTDWQAVVTSNTTMVAGRGYFVNTTSGAITMTLPASPSAGDTVVVKDYTGTFATNNCTIARNSSNIGGSATDYIADTNNLSLTLVYADSTEGWVSVSDNTTSVGSTYVSATGGTVSTSGDYKIHTFNSTSNFVVSSVSNTSPNNVADYLVVAGGGSGPTTGGGDGISGGGGGGGFRLYASPANPQSGNPASPKIAPAGITVSASTYPITIGAGGAISGPVGSNGSNSVFSTITSAGGGRGGRGDPSGSGVDGGSGGGGSNGSGAGAGNVPPVSPSQGNDGASGGPASGGGGGGALSAGTAGGPTGGPGGAGGGVTGFGTAGESSGGKYYFSGGGGGGNGNANSGNSAGAGGLGGAGDGITPSANSGPAGAGTANTGGGGGGASDRNPGGAFGGTGGSGIVIIRYKYQN